MPVASGRRCMAVCGRRDVSLPPQHPESTSCEAAVRVKPRARLCEPWVNVVNKFVWSRGAATLICLCSPISRDINAVAAPRLRQLFDSTQGSQSLALGLTLTAASQLVGQLFKVTQGSQPR